MSASARSGADRLAELLRTADRVLALTGAGISVPSGIPDFRSPGSGLWANVDPMEVAHIEVFLRDPERFWRFYGHRFAALRDKRPKERTTRSSSSSAAECSRRSSRRTSTACTGSRHARPDRGPRLDRDVLVPAVRAALRAREVRTRLAATADGVPRCDCGAALKPDVVLFGELLPEAALARVSALAGEVEVLLCVGSSLEVYPVAQLPRITLAAGGSLALVTSGPTPYDGEAAVKLDGDVEAELAAVVAAV